MMATVGIVGDGPAGLSAALFLAKNGHVARVYGQDETAMHHALLRNYLGIDELAGSRFQAAARAQVERFGAELVDDRVTEVDQRDGETGPLTVQTEGGRRDEVDYLVLAGAKRCAALARQLGIEAGRDGVEVDTEYRTGTDRVYAVGRLARPGRSQAIVSAGAGATAALDILAREAGEDVTDWDTPEDD
jgi:thioredoxin reductase (NADPH)